MLIYIETAGSDIQSTPASSEEHLLNNIPKLNFLRKKQGILQKKSVII